MKHTFFVPGIGHTTDRHDEYSCSAFSQKILRWSPAMMARGHDVVYLGNERSTVEATEIIPCVSQSQFEDFYGAYEKDNLPEYDVWNDYPHKLLRLQASYEIRKRAKKNDFLCCFFGWGHYPIVQELEKDSPVIPVEPSIGYPESFGKHRVYQSDAFRHARRGVFAEKRGNFGRLSKEDQKKTGFNPAQMVSMNEIERTEAVIHHFFNPDEFEVVDKNEVEDYFFYLGRIKPFKGVEDAIKIAEAYGVKLLVAGQGDFTKEMGFAPPKHVELLGALGMEERKHYMARAKVVLCLSHYIEPFCGVIVEAAFSGRPVVAYDFGACTETIIDEVTGFRVMNYDEALTAVSRIDEIHPAVCRWWAENNFTPDIAAEKYEIYFDRLLSHILQFERNNDEWYTDKNNPARLMPRLKYPTNVDKIIADYNTANPDGIADKNLLGDKLAENYPA